MTLPRFELARPADVGAAVKLLAGAGAEGKAIAGGSDLLPNLKHGFVAPRLLVAVARLPELGGVASADGALTIGAGERLMDVGASALVRAGAGILADACGRAAHPQARAMGTLGGNLCLDTRCRWINRPAAWRQALGGCLKRDGTECHVVPGGRRCVAALAGDTVAPLVALRATAVIVGPGGERRLPVEDVRGKDGAAPLALAHGELVRALAIPAAPERRLAVYHKWAVRKAVDFPLVSFALVCDRDEAGRVADLRVAVCALGPRPRVVARLERFRGERLDAPLAAAVAAEVVAQCVPLPNLLYDEGYRRRLLGVLVTRQLEAWAGG